MNTRTMRTIDKVSEPNKKLKHKIASAIFAVVVIATGGLGTSAPAVARPDAGSALRQDDAMLRSAVIRCWKPGLKTHIDIVRKSIRRTAIGYVASSYGCTMWRLLDYEIQTPPAVGPLGGGCDPEQARAMGFKPERGDCNL